MFVWPLTVAVEVRVVVTMVWAAVDVTHSSSSDYYHEWTTDPLNRLTSAAEARDESVSELKG